MNRKSISKENKLLKKQLAIAKHEISLIKSSKAYRVTNILGRARSEIKKSPVNFSKKLVSKALKGSLSTDIKVTENNLAVLDQSQNEYENWIQFNEPDYEELKQQKELSKNFNKQPTISIITPVFNPPIDVLKELIISVLNQTYGKFELCLGNFGDDKKVISLLEKYKKIDKRLKVYTFEKNLGIAENSNQILKKVKGEYIALLDHDDTLSPDALFENVKMINDKDCDFIYSDKDKIDQSGKRFEPFFKPRWSPEMMLNVNYLTHLNLMKTSIVKKVGGWSSDTDGAQDWDLFLKVIENSKIIEHIPKVLYHWRIIATSTALSIETKPYALNGQRTAVDKYLNKNKIAATTYHHGAELLLKWKENDIESIVFCIQSTNEKNTLANIERIKSDYPTATTLVFCDYSVINIENSILHKNIKLIYLGGNSFLSALKFELKKVNNHNIFLFKDDIKFDLSPTHLNHLNGWLNVKNVSAVSPRIIDNKKITVDCGALIINRKIMPIFSGARDYQQAPLGNIEWVRNLKVLNSFAFICSKNILLNVLDNLSEKTINNNYSLTAIQLSMPINSRLVLDPKIKLSVIKDIDMAEYYEDCSDQLALLLKNLTDPYNNINLSPVSPMHIAIFRDTEDGRHNESIGVDINNSYLTEAMIHAENRDLTSAELSSNFDNIESTKNITLQKVNNCLFILPDFNGVYAGLNNIFSFANFLLSNGTHITFAIMAQNDDFSKQKQLLLNKYKDLSEKAEFININPIKIKKLKHYDIAICTQWATAYLLALFNNTKRKLYFIQDKEASFYPKGSTSALVEYTYRLGFYAIANTKGLLDWYHKEFSGNGIVLKSTIDLNSYGPNKTANVKPAKPYKVFFYARPYESRNAFEIGIAGLKKIKERFGNDINIYAAGSEWDPEEFELEGKIINLGKIPYDNLARFYRSMDVGVMFMFSGHPGVVASELMASGCPVVVNEYNDETWNELYIDGETCLVTPPTASIIAEKISELISNIELRTKIIKLAENKANEFYGNYHEECEKTFNYIKKPIN